jgi:hypothetical protein
MNDPCGCPQNSGGDISCHVCGEKVNIKCWRCQTPRGEGTCRRAWFELDGERGTREIPMSEVEENLLWANALLRTMTEQKQREHPELVIEWMRTEGFENALHLRWKPREPAKSL